MDFLSSPDIDNSLFVTKYIKRYEIVTNIHNKMIELTNDSIVLKGEGNICSPLVIVLQDKSQDSILPIYKSILSSKGFRLSDVYITYLNKCSNNKLNALALKRELNLFEPDYNVVLIHGFNIDNYKVPTICIDFPRYLPMINKSIKGEEYNTMKKEFYQKVVNAFKHFFKIYS